MILDQLPIFMLSNFYLFPQTIFPLVIFEPRYIALLQYAIQNQMFFAIAHPKENDLSAIDPKLMLARIVKVERVPNKQQYMIFVEGLERLELIQELPQDQHPFRMVEAKILEDDQLSMDEELQMALYEKELKDFLIQYNMLHPNMTAFVDFIFENYAKKNEPDHFLLNLISAHFLTDSAKKNKILKENSPFKRMQFLIQELPNLLLKGYQSDLKQ